MADLLSNFDLHARIAIDAAIRSGIDDAAAVMQPLRAQTAALEAALDEVAANHDLNPDGVLRQKVAAAQKVETQHAAWKAAHLDVLDQEIVRVEGAVAQQMVAAIPAPNPLAVKTLARTLAPFDSVQRQHAFSTADPATRVAMLAASEQMGPIPVAAKDGGVRWEYLVDPEAAARHRDAALRDAAPELTATLRTLQARRAFLRNLSSTVTTLIGSVIKAPR